MQRFRRFVPMGLVVLALVASAVTLGNWTAVKAVDSSYVIAVIGDYGCASGSYCGNAATAKTADVATMVHGWSPNAIVTVGDNSYEHGCAGTAFTGATNTNCAASTNEISLDQTNYATDISNRIFYEVPGNHDFENKKNVINGASSTTDCPAGAANCGYYYNRPSHYTAHLGNGLLDLFALNVRASDPDGTGASSAQASAYTTDYNNSTAVWKIVTQHEANFSSGQHGSFASDQALHSNQPTSWTIKSGIDLFLNGHDHDMEHLTCQWNSSAKDCTGGGAAQDFVTVGVGGKNLYGFAGHPACPFTGHADVEDCKATTVWRDDTSPYHFGAAKLTFTHGGSDTLKVEYFGLSNNLLHSFTLTKGVSVGNISGTITSSAGGAAIQGAKVSTQGTDAFTDASGNYTLTNIPTGAQTLTISASGYQTATLSATSPSTGNNKALDPSTAIYGSGFETGNFSEWTSSVGGAALNVCSTGGGTTCTPHLGTYAADFNPANTTGGTYLTKTFTNAGTIDIRSYFNVASATSNASLFYFQTSTGGNMFHPYVDATTRKIGIRVDFGTPSTVVSCTTTPTFPWGGFHEIEFQAQVAGSGNSTIQGWYDGAQITWPNPGCPGASSTSQNIGNTNAGKVILGDTASNRTFHYVADDAAVDKQYIGSATRDITGNVKDVAGVNVSGATVALTGGGSTTTDASGNYTLSAVEGNRNVTVTASKTNYNSSPVTSFMAFGDTAYTQNFTLTITPGSITGQIKDSIQGSGLAGALVSDDEGSTVSDGSGNYTLSGQDPGVHLVTASLAGKNDSSASPTVPTGGGSVSQDLYLAPDVFGDGFETNDFSAWTTNTNMTICTSAVSGCPHGGTYGAEGSTTTGNTYVKKTFAANYTEAWARTYFYVKSQGANNVSLIHLVNTSNAQIGHVFLNASQQVGFKNDVGGAATQSTTAVSTGAWHSIELHIKTGSSTGVADTYLDGTAIGTLSLTSQNLGTTNIGGMWLNDNQASRTYDVLFDHVEAQDAYIGTA